jgi:drug/metabolite transporter (DMT)-like permease
MPAWLLWTLFAMLSWGVWAILSKLIGEALSAGQIQALSTLGLLPVLLALGLSKRLAASGSRRRGAFWALGAGVVSALGNVAYFDALRRDASASSVVALTALYPLVTVVLAMGLLREKLNRIQLAGVALSLGAMYLLNVASEEGLFSSRLVLALAPIGLWGLAGFLQKLSTNDISGELSALCFLAAFVPLAPVLLFREPLSAQPPPAVWLLAAAVGFTLALGNFAVLGAFARSGKASIIAPLAGLYPLVSVPIAILFLDELPGRREALGIALAILSVAALCCERRARSLEET